MKIMPSIYRLGFMYLISVALMACAMENEKLATAPSTVSDDCSELFDLSLPRTVITQVKSVAAGNYLVSEWCYSHNGYRSREQI